MRFVPRIVTSVAAIAFTCLASAAAVYYYRRRKTEINDVMIFCKLQFNPYNYFDKLLNLIESAEKTIKVCMPSIHNPAVQGHLVDVIKRKNISVQIIIDADGYNDSTAMFLEELIDVGAEIKFKAKYGTHSMHHKFCLVDDSILMTGTLDWGKDITFDHWNYVYITTKEQLVQPVRSAFHNMWHDERNRILIPAEYSDSESKAEDQNETAGNKEPSVKPENVELNDNEELVKVKSDAAMLNGNGPYDHHELIQNEKLINESSVNNVLNEHATQNCGSE